MPIVSSTYKAPYYLFNGHIETIYPFLFRRVKNPAYERERIHLPDGDFLDLDWLKQGNQRLLILCHGLEGSSSSQYMKGMANMAYAKGWDVLAVNFRSCSGEPNHKVRMYHHGEITDLEYIIEQVIVRDDYGSISLCGYSLGGNVVIKYLGTRQSDMPEQIESAIAVSVPCDLGSSSRALDEWQNYLYTRRFRNSLKKKFKEKNRRFPGTLDMRGYDRVGSWYDFDSKYTTALTPFESADEYYDQGSANNFIPGVQIPTLLVQALNDPFLQEASYPRAICRDHKYLYLETPRHGGHVGFWGVGHKESYLEKRVIRFLEEVEKKGKLLEGTYRSSSS